LVRLPLEEKALKKGVYSLLRKEAIFGPRKKGPEKLKNPKNARGESGGQKSKKAKYAQNVPFSTCFSKKGPKRPFLAPFWECKILFKKAIF